MSAYCPDVITGLSLLLRVGTRYESICEMPQFESRLRGTLILPNRWSIVHARIALNAFLDLI